ncbi:MAG: sigma-54-dependent transcriptional regulator [Candidatus Zixiibacteriota bacterium]
MLRYRILVVDDQESQREMLGGHLKNKGYAVTTAESGESALEICEKNFFEVALLDLKMPGLSGLDLLNRLKEINPDTISIIITAYGSIESAVEALKSGAFDYITKPINNLEEVDLIIEKALETHSLLRENRALKEELEKFAGKLEIIGESRQIREVLSTVTRVAPSDANVLLTGESGTGKELFARALHQASERTKGTFVAVSCAALPETLLESELFGHEKGAFTDAKSKRAGRFELAHGGTLFLDEIGDVPASTQVKLLRVIETKEYNPLGSEKTYLADVRIIAATNQNLEEKIKEGTFREDLFFRLNVVGIEVPPLRDRKADISLLTDYFLRELSEKNRKRISGITPEVKDLLLRYHWPGNVRELENVLERAVVMCRGEVIDVGDLPPQLSEKSATGEETRPTGTLREMEKEYIFKALEATSWNFTEAAAILGIHRNTLRLKLKEYGIEKEK